jgi:hypothetical protein
MTATQSLLQTPTALHLEDFGNIADALNAILVDAFVFLTKTKNFKTRLQTESLNVLQKAENHRERCQAANTDRMATPVSRLKMLYACFTPFRSPITGNFRGSCRLYNFLRRMRISTSHNL